MNQINNLYIFVTSQVPDVYINSIGHCIEHYELDRIILLGIIKDRGRKFEHDSKLADLKNNISRQLTLLQENKYLFIDQATKEWDDKNIQIENYDKTRYLKISEKNIETLTIIYDDLDTKISDFSEHANNIFDVSAIAKSYLVDIYTLLLSRDIFNIFTFELKLRTRTYDENELIHNLSLDNSDYEYINISKSCYTEDKVIREVNAERNNEIYVQAFDALTQKLSSKFASIIFGFYGIFLIMVYIAIIYFVVNNDWNILEPYTFLLFGLSLLPYIISVFSIMIFKRELSLSPITLYNQLKNYKLSQLSIEHGIENNDSQNAS